MRGSKLVGALAIAAGVAVALVGCKNDEEHHRDKGPSTAATGSATGAGGAGGEASIDREKSGTIEGTVARIDRDKMLCAITPTAGRESGGELCWIDLSSAEL